MKADSGRASHAQRVPQQAGAGAFSWRQAFLFLLLVTLTMLVFRLATRSLTAPWVLPEAAALTIATMQTPEAPAGLVARAGDGFIELIWNDPVDDSIIDYQFRVQSLTDLDWRSWKNMVREHAGTIHYTIWGLTNGCPYRIQLRALSSVGAGPPGEDVFIAPGTLSPVAPEDFNPERQAGAWHDWPGCWASSETER